jgi:hypothetical protein
LAIEREVAAADKANHRRGGVLPAQQVELGVKRMSE